MCAIAYIERDRWQTITMNNTAEIAGINIKTGNIELKQDRRQLLLASYPQLGQIQQPEWLEMINQAKIMQFPADTVLFSGSNSCNNFMLILEGCIRIYQTAEDGREMTLYRVFAGDLCVLSLNSMLQNKSFNAIAEAETAIQALVLSETDFYRAMNMSETFRNYVLSTITGRLCDSMYLIQTTAFDHLNMRLACMLGSLFERSQGKVLKITHQELAHELGTTREVISRILKEFERQNCVKLSRGQIELASAEGLNWFTGSAD